MFTPTSSSSIRYRLARFAHEAMACTWELFVSGEDPAYAEQAARAVFEEVDRIEQELSRFVEHSDIARINSLPAGQSLRLGIEAFECLELAGRIHAETNGAFDITAGGDSIGMHLLELDPATRSVAVRAELTSLYPVCGTGFPACHGPVGKPVPHLGVVIDLGGVGKGYAVDRAVEILRDWNIESALLSAGQSTVYALGEPRLVTSPPRGRLGLQPESPDRGQARTAQEQWHTGPGWPLAIRNPQAHSVSLGVVHLKDRALSGSGTLVHGPHILDPRTGKPAAGTVGAWALCESAALSDALSTAFMVLTPEEVRGYCGRHPGVSAMIYPGQDQEPKLLRFGDER